MSGSEEPYECVKCDRRVLVEFDEARIHVKISRGACLMTCREAVAIPANRFTHPAA